MYIVEKFYRNCIDKILPWLGSTRITPNMITISNIIFSFYIFWEAYNKNYIIVAILFQVYEFIDHLDGSLARYKDMSSKFGAKLDFLADFIFYNFIFIFIGFGTIKWYLITMLLLTINGYGFIATHYIGPRLKTLKVLRRTGLKKWFMDKGIIFGMDLSLMGVLVSVFLIFNKISLLYVVLICTYMFDIIYRIKELKYNEKLKCNN